jgi:hypothetical protein
MQTRGVCVGLILTLLLSPVSAAVSGAQEPAPEARVARDLPPEVLADRAAYVLAYDHTTGNVTLRDHKGAVQEQWVTRGATHLSAPLAPVPPDRPLIVAVENANSLQYDYSVAVDVVGSKKLRSCSNIGGQFATSALLVGLGSIQGLASPAPPDIAYSFDQTFWEFETDDETRGEARLSEASLEQTLELVRAPVTEFIGFTEDVGRLSSSLEDSLNMIAMLAE